MGKLEQPTSGTPVKTPEQIQSEAWQHLDVGLVREGEKIVLPAQPHPMATRDGVKVLQRIIAAEERIYDISEVIPVHFFDGLVAFGKALKQKYGYADTTDGTVNTFFGKMKVPPRLLNIRTGPHPRDVMQVPFGTFDIPGVEGSFETKYDTVKGMPVVRLVGQVKSNERDVILEIIELATKIAKTDSIYRGRSIILESDTDENIELDEPLDFFDPDTGFEVPIFNDDTQALIDTALLAPLRFTDRCRALKVPLKRGVLLAGPYGTGKTLAAKQVARVGNAAGWTFILVKQATSLQFALNFAKMYQPAIVFAEDMDRIAGNRNEGANNLINEIDGVVGKTDEIMTVMTTNFPERIDKAFLRPGRLDTVVSIKPPEADAVMRLIRFYAGELLDPKVDLGPVAKELAGNIPATIREVVERSKLSMLVVGGKTITTDDLTTAHTLMQTHLKLMEEAKEGEQTPPAIDTSIKNIMQDVIQKKFGR